MKTVAYIEVRNMTILSYVISVLAILLLAAMITSDANDKKFAVAVTALIFSVLAKYFLSQYEKKASRRIIAEHIRNINWSITASFAAVLYYGFCLTL